jgi:His-Xaa-Ser repeat protein HxsA
MKWRDRLALLLGAASPFAFGGAATALPIPQGLALAALRPGIDRDAWVYADPVQKTRLALLARHGSHSSHSSHASHASHYSGSGGSTVSPSYPASVPAPTLPVSPPPPPRPVPPSTSSIVSSPTPLPNATPAAAGSGVTDLDPDAARGGERLTKGELQLFIQKTQIALLMKGYDPGPADGQLGPKTKTALKQFQEANSLPGTGFMDVDTLRRLGVIN